MTTPERAAALQAYGFTPRQAVFLTAVLLHGGVCVPRQYCGFAGITRGQVVQDFFGRLTAQRFATVYACARKGSHVYHLHHKALYRAIGEAESRYRRRASVERALERLMVLDAVLMKSQLRWLATEREKVTYCRQRRKLSEEDLPRVTFEGTASRTVRYFAEKLPLGVSDGSDEVALLYLVTEPTARLFRTFLEAHRALLQHLSRWRLLLVLPRALATAEAAHRAAVTDLCAAPLRPAVLDEFRWFCGVRAPQLWKRWYCLMCTQTSARSSRRRDHHRTVGLDRTTGRTPRRTIGEGGRSTAIAAKDSCRRSADVSSNHLRRCEQLTESKTVRAQEPEKNAEAGRRIVPPSLRDEKPHSGQERPPLRRPSVAPEVTPDRGSLLPAMHHTTHGTHVRLEREPSRMSHRDMHDNTSAHMQQRRRTC